MTGVTDYARNDESQRDRGLVEEEGLSPIAGTGTAVLARTGLHCAAVGFLR